MAAHQHGTARPVLLRSGVAVMVTLPLIGLAGLLQLAA
jgi:hypothetical protein